MKNWNFLWKFHFRDSFYFHFVNKISTVIENKANCEYKWKFYNEIVELNIKQLNYYLLLFLFMWWETASKKSKLEIGFTALSIQIGIISQVYPFGNLHMKYVFKAMLYKFRNLFLFFNKFHFFLNSNFQYYYFSSWIKISFPDFAFRVLWQIFYNKCFMTNVLWQVFYDKRTHTKWT